MFITENITLYIQKQNTVKTLVDLHLESRLQFCSPNLKEA